MTIIEIKSELYKMILSIIPAGFFIWTQEMHFAIITFALLITLDTITGALNSTIYQYSLPPDTPSSNFFLFFD